MCISMQHISKTYGIYFSYYKPINPYIIYIQPSLQGLVCLNPITLILNNQPSMLPKLKGRWVLLLAGLLLCVILSSFVSAQAPQGEDGDGVGGQQGVAFHQQDWRCWYRGKWYDHGEWFRRPRWFRRRWCWCCHGDYDCYRHKRDDWYCPNDTWWNGPPSGPPSPP